jgi:ankyrin repeat protein
MCVLVQYGRTPLIIACLNKDEVTAALLMEATKKAGVLDAQITEEASNNIKKTALHFACKYKMASTVEKLVTLGSNAALLDNVRSYHA